MGVASIPGSAIETLEAHAKLIMSHIERKRHLIRRGVTPSERVIETRWRRITTRIPAPESVAMIERLRSVEPRSMTAMPPVVWHEAEGFLVRDPCGNQWIDLTSGIVVANAGHGHPRILAAIKRAAEQGPLFTYAFPSQIRLQLLEKLVALAPIADAKAILYSAGTEATECAIGLMRRYGRAISPEKVGILSFRDGFHGRTLAASMAAGRPGPNDWIARERLDHYQIPFPFCVQCPWGRECQRQCGANCFDACLQSLRERNIGPEQIAGIIVEPLPGWTTWPIPKDFARAMRDWAREHDILIAFDEVQCGCGRTGKFFGCEHVGVVPDLITLGKGLTSSLPVSAVIGPQWLMDVPEPGEMSSTHGGNPVCAAAALENLCVIEDERLVKASEVTGRLVLEHLQKVQDEFPERVLSIHGRGLFISAHLKLPGGTEPDIEMADAVAAEAVRRGVLMFPTGRGFLKIAPPLCIDPNAAIEAVYVIRDCLRDLIMKKEQKQ